MAALTPTEFAVVPITTREAYSNKHIYQILIDRLIRLEHMLVSRGFEGPIARIQFHLRILKELQRTPRIADDQTLWSLVGGPDYFQIDKEILMDGYVAHPAHLRPWKLGMLCDEVRRGAVDLVNGLADDLYVADNRVLNLPILLKGLEVWYGLKVVSPDAS